MELRTAPRNSTQSGSNVKHVSATAAAAPHPAARPTGTGRPAPPAAGQTPPTTAQSLVGMVTLRYLAGAPIQVVGPVTHARYRFSREAPLQRVARADAELLLASGYFQMEI